MIEFKSREEAVFWQLLVVAATQHPDKDGATYADEAVEAFRTRMQGVEREETEFRGEVVDLLKKAKESLAQKPTGILGLVPPGKKDPSDPTN